MVDKIFIEGLGVRCVIGTLPRERRKRQKVVLDMEFPAPVSRPAKQDDLRDAVNYKKIADHAVKFVSRSRFRLIETLAERLSRQLLKEFKLRRILLRVSKPGAIRNAKNVGVEIQRP
jgi:dihydroneopterin aldolase